jgi:hypothetical protein
MPPTGMPAAPPLAAPSPSDPVETMDKRPAKKLRQSGAQNGDAMNSNGVSETTSTRLAHPFGIKPIGNYYEDMDKGIRDCRASGMGRFRCLSDIAMLDFLNWLAPKDLCTLSACSRACYVYGSHDELWRTLVLEEMEGNFVAKTSWKQSYIATKTGRGEWSDALRPIQVQGFYSDLLFQAFYCAAAPVEASWLAVENIDRRSAKDLPLETFKAEYETANQPVIITECIDTWPAMAKWTDAYLIEHCRDQTFSAGGFQMPMDKYLHYSRTLKDDQPLFIFDKEFATKVPQLASDYAVPEYFQEDFFALLGAEHRPDHKWLIIGPAKSGSSFHIDPNSTNAWNGVIRGAKKWILFPPEIVPPGVHPSEDGSDVSTPVSLFEWFVTFYPQVQKLPPSQRPREGICRAGEVIFVPHGWWHIVLNMEESIAITQNFVSTGNLRNVVRFLEDTPNQVSGLPTERRPLLGGMLRDAMEKNQPELLAKVDAELQEERAKKNRKSKWELLVHGDQEEDTGGGRSDAVGFSFGFSF